MEKPEKRRGKNIEALQLDMHGTVAAADGGLLDVIGLFTRVIEDGRRKWM